MDKKAKIYVAGHKGLVGSALVKVLNNAGYHNVIGRSHAEMDLQNQSQVLQFFETEKPEYVFLAAAKVGGIHANNTYPAEFIFSNLQIQNNIIDASHKFGVKKLCFLGSSCIYPKFAKQPMDEGQLLDGSWSRQTNRMRWQKLRVLFSASHITDSMEQILYP